MSDGTVLRGKYDRMVEDRDAWRGAARQADAELAQLKAGWAEDDARLLRAEVGWAEASDQLAQVKAELYEAINARCNCCGWIAGVPFDHEGEPTWSELRDGRDNALRHLEAVLEWSNTERFAGRTRHENDAPSAARAFFLFMREKADSDA